MTEAFTEKSPRGDKSAIVLSSRVRVARNLKDMNFRPKMTQDQADECIDRVLEALRGGGDDFRYYPTIFSKRTTGAPRSSAPTAGW